MFGTHDCLDIPNRRQCAKRECITGVNVSNDKKATPRQPIIRKKKAEAQASETDQEESNPQAEKAEEPTPEPSVESAASEESVEEAAQEEPPQKGPSRRVVDMKRYSSAKADGKKANVARQDPKVQQDEPDAITQKAIDEDVSVSVDTSASMEDFAAMLDSSGMGDVKRQRFSVGDQVDARISNIGEKYVYFELGGVDEGIGLRSDFADDEGELSVSVGESVKLYVINLKGGTVHLANKLSSSEAALEVLEAAYSTGVPVEGRVEATNKGGFDVLIDGLRAFCPLSQIELAYTEEPDAHIGKTYRFKVTKFDEAGRNIVVSRSVLQAAEQAVIAEELKETLEVGSVVQGKVTRLADFGAFVDVGGGIEGLVHVSELGFSRVEHPSEAVSVGDVIEVAVKKIEETDEGQLRIGLSLKATKEDPWLARIGDFVEGQQVEGTVTRLESFGAFVEIADGLEGLVHISEMSWEQHVKRAQDVVSVGDRVSVEILNIDAMKQRMGLSLKLQSGDPWSSIEERFALGSEVSGQVENIEDFGAFIRLPNGITALLPRSEMNLQRDATPHMRFKKGEEVTARVLSIETDRRRMALTLKSASELAESKEAGPSTYEDKKEESSGFGTLGDLLKNKLES